MTGRSAARSNGAQAESLVVAALRRDLPPGSRVLAGLQLELDGLQRELDAVALIPGIGLAVIEVKAGRIRLEDGQWLQGEGRGHPIDPVYQARRGLHGLLGLLRELAPEANGVRATYLVAFPGTAVQGDLRTPDLTRRMILDTADLAQQHSGVRVLEALTRDGVGHLVPNEDLCARIGEALGPSFPGQSGELVAAATQEVLAQQLTQEQAEVLSMVAAMPRVHIVGGAGTGKTWLAVEQARRLTAAGQRVALLCYSRGLGRYLQRLTGSWRRDRPAWVGLFHELPVHWGAEPGDDLEPADWEERLPRDLARLAEGLPEAEKFDAIVVDEAQDFGDLWWPALLKCLRDPEHGGLTVFSDDSQRVFPRDGHAPIEHGVITLGKNLRSTRQIARTFGALGDAQLTPLGLAGHPVRLVEAGDAADLVSADAQSRRRTSEAVLAAADDAVDALLDEGWEPGHIAVLTTGSRHPEQRNAIELGGHEAYWDACLAEEDVFYGHVLNFKGLERRAVVLAVNGMRDAGRARRMLYTGMSRARSLLVVVGPLGYLESVGAEAMTRRLAAAIAWHPGETG